VAGNKIGGRKTAETMIKRHGEDFYRKIGAKGGKVKCMKGFALDRERAKWAGAIGGRVSRRGKSMVKSEA
jgi:general stress protein YciG